MKQFVCFMSPNKGYKTYNKYHNYHVKRKFISDSSYHMLKPHTNRKLQFYRIFLPILLRETRIGDVIHRLRHLNFAKYVSALCHNIQLWTFYSVNMVWYLLNLTVLTEAEPRSILSNSVNIRPYLLSKMSITVLLYSETIYEL